MTEIKKARQSNFELLRIFAMLLIVMSHLCQHGVWFAPDAEVTTNYYVRQAFSNWTGALGNYLFILTSGFFIANSKFSWKKVFRLWFQVFSIAAVIGVALYVSKVPLIGFDRQPEYIERGFFDAASPASLKDLVRSFAPTLFGNNWFASAYLLFYMMTPFLNESLKYLDEKKHRNLIILITSVTIIACVTKQGIYHPSNIFAFVIGYYIANYIRLNNPNLLNNQRRNVILSVLILAFFVVWKFVIIRFRSTIPFIDGNFDKLIAYPMSMNRFFACRVGIFVFQKPENQTQQVCQHRRRNHIRRLPYPRKLVAEQGDLASCFPF